jgi:hypothetical protein
VAEGDPAVTEPSRTEEAPAPRTPAPDEPTVGTGSAVAIGCVVATVLITIVGILIVLWIR